MGHLWTRFVELDDISLSLPNPHNALYSHWQPTVGGSETSPGLAASFSLLQI